MLVENSSNADDKAALGAYSQKIFRTTPSRTSEKVPFKSNIAQAFDDFVCSAPLTPRNYALAFIVKFFKSNSLNSWF